MKSTAVLILFVFSMSAALADYVATGQIEGEVCWGFVIQSCRFAKIEAVAGEGGRLYTVRQRYDDVSDYNAVKGRCWITIHRPQQGMIADAINAFVGAEFYEKADDGTFEKVDVEYLTFPCRSE